MNDNATLSVAVMSGKGGVGKTNISLNLAQALHGMGNRVLLMDCDLGLANLDVLMGLAPEGTLQDVLLGDAEVREIIQPAGADGFDVLPAASGVPELVDLDEDMRDMLIRQLNPVLYGYDYVFLDLGAGINTTVQAFGGMTAVRLVVVTPEPTSVTDGYALMKVLAHNCGVRDFFVVVNQVESRREADITFQRLQAACRRFLDMDPVLLGAIHHDSHVVEAVRRQTPLIKLFPTCNAARDLSDIARAAARLRVSAAGVLRGKPVLDPLPI